MEETPQRAGLRRQDHLLASTAGLAEGRVREKRHHSVLDRLSQDAALD